MRSLLASRRSLIACAVLLAFVALFASPIAVHASMHAPAHAVATNDVALESAELRVVMTIRQFHAPFRLPPIKWKSAFVALLCAFAVLVQTMPTPAAIEHRLNDHVMQLMHGANCAQSIASQTLVAQATPQALVSPSPTPFGATPSPTPSANPFGPSPTPMPFGMPTPAHVTPPPVPTPTPDANANPSPIFLVRGGETPPPIPPAGGVQRPGPLAAPSGAPTLPPNDIAILSDKVDGNTSPGKPGDAIGNVHIFYATGEIVGDRAHFDGLRTVTITGHPYLINHNRDSILQGNTIVFDTISQTAKLTGGRGTSDQGVDQGLVHFKATDLHTDAGGVAHGKNAFITTCERWRSGYHMTGKTMDVYPGQKIVIHSVILWLGAAAVFFLPLVVIPLRQVVDETRRPSYFPLVGYDEPEGFWIKTQLGFGKDQYYYGYYRVDYFTKVGLGLGYVGFYTKKNGKRSMSVNAYGIRDRRVQTTTFNLQAQETENFSQTLRGQFGLNYQSAYGPLTNLPPSTSLNGMISHTGLHSQQAYGFTRSSTGSQSSSTALSFSDTRQLRTGLSNQLNYSFNTSQTSYGGISSSNSTAHFTNTTNIIGRKTNTTVTFDKNFSAQPFGYSKLPEVTIRPNQFFPHFIVPVQGNFTVGEYSEAIDSFATSRAALAFTVGPAVYRIYNSDLSANLNVTQYAYGTGDLKASIQQAITLQTPIGRHFANTLAYNEANFNGPATVPFSQLDLLSSINSKSAQDTLRFFNGDVYSGTLNFSTLFNGQAQPVSYNLIAKPSPRSLVLLGGAFSPGSGQGFEPTTFQIASPFGRGGQIQFVGTFDWKNKGRIINKTIYFSHIIGDCYELRLQYNQALKIVNVSVDILAFPNRAANFGVGQNGPIIPSGFNF